MTTTETIVTVTCLAYRYRYSAERDCISITSPTGKTITVKLLGCKDMPTYWKFSDIIQAADGGGDFKSNYDSTNIELTKAEMEEFIELSKKK